MFAKRKLKEISKLINQILFISTIFFWPVKAEISDQQLHAKKAQKEFSAFLPISRFDPKGNSYLFFLLRSCGLRCAFRDQLLKKYSITNPDT